MKKKSKNLKRTTERFINKLIEENDEVRLIKEITRLSTSTVKVPVPFSIDKSNYYKV
jgi:hypothetical protein